MQEGEKVAKKWYLVILIFLGYLGEIESDFRTVWTCMCACTTLLCHGQYLQFSSPNLQLLRIDF